MIDFRSPRLQCDASGVGGWWAASPRVHPRFARASPAVKHGAPPLEAGLHEDNAYYLEEEILPLQV